MSDSAGQQDDAPTGLDAPTPPGGPQRGDAAGGSDTPGGSAEPETGSQPEAHPTSTSDQQTIPGPASGTEPTADGEIHARTQAEQVNEELQEENAETALDQPSDGSGGE